MKKREELVKYSRRIAAKHLVIGSSGNISAKKGAHMLIKASGVCFEDMELNNFVQVNLKTLHFDPKKNSPSCEFKMHAACYRTRPEINYVIHSHPLYATLLVSVGIKPQILSPEFVICIGNQVGVVPYICPGTEKLSKEVSRLIVKNNLVYLKNHGLVAVGKTISEAYQRTCYAEQMAKMQVLALAMNKKIKTISSVEIKKLLEFK